MLREGGNAVDAAVAAMLTSFVAEPLLTGLGAGRLHAGRGRRGVRSRRCWTSSCRRPRAHGDGSEASCRRSTCPSGTPRRSSTSARPPAACTGRRRACARRSRRWGTVAARGSGGAGGAARARGRRAQRRAGVRRGDPRRAAHLDARVRGAVGARGARAARGRGAAQPRAGGGARAPRRARARSPFYRGDVADAVCDWLADARGLAHARGPRRLSGDRARAGADAATATARSSPTRRPRRAARCSPTRWRCSTAARRRRRSRRSWPRWQPRRERTPEFLEGSPPRASSSASSPSAWARPRRRGCARSSRTGAGGRDAGAAAPALRGIGHHPHLRARRRRAARAASPPPTARAPGWWCRALGIHLNNMMGEQDLNPFGFHRHPAGLRMPSMMAPSVVMRDGEVELVLGSAGSNRIRSALLQTIVGVVDRGLSAQAAVRAPRVHFEDGVLYAEPGIDARAMEAPDRRGRGASTRSTSSSAACRRYNSATGSCWAPATPAAVGWRWRREAPLPRRGEPSQARGRVGRAGRDAHARRRPRRLRRERHAARPLPRYAHGGRPRGTADGARQRRRRGPLQRRAGPAAQRPAADPGAGRSQEELQSPATHHLSLRPRPGSVFQLLRARRRRVRCASPTTPPVSPLCCTTLRCWCWKCASRSATCPWGEARPRAPRAAPQPKRTLPLDCACARARSTSSRRLIAARNSIVSRRRRAFSERSSSSSCLASAPNSTVAAIR